MNRAERIVRGGEDRLADFLRRRSGAVLQTKTAVFAGTDSLGIATFTDLSSLNISITPLMLGSKFLCLAFLSVGQSGSGQAAFRITRDGTALDVGTTAGSRTSAGAGGGDIANAAFASSVTVAADDVPNDLKEHTYKVQWWIGGGTASLFLNRSGTDTDTSAFIRTSSMFMVQELSP